MTCRRICHFDQWPLFDPAVALPYNRLRRSAPLFATLTLTAAPASIAPKISQGGTTVAIESVRVGLIGAGRNTRDRHIPGVQQHARR